MKNALDYVKNRTHYEKPAVWSKLGFTEPIIGGISTTMFVPKSNVWAADKTYRIRVDGEEYTFDGMTQKYGGTAFQGKDVYYIGAEWIAFNDNMNWTEYPFSFVTADYENVYAVFEDGTTRHTVEFLESEGEVKQLDKKYIPDSIARTEDVNGKMDVNNPVGTGSFSIGRQEGSGVGEHSFAFGIDCVAFGNNSVAIGKGTVASRSGVIALGNYNLYDDPLGFYDNIASQTYRGGASKPCYASNEYSFDAENGKFSLVEPLLTTYEEAFADGLTYVVQNISETNAYDFIWELKAITSTKVTYFRHSAVSYSSSTGKYRIIVGNGKPSSRSNSHTLDYDGVPWYQGRPQFGGNAQDDGAQTVMANGDTELILTSSTADSTKQFRITVDDTGTLTATEVTE